MIKKTQVEMIRDRGYIIPDDERSLFLDGKDPTDEHYEEFLRRYTGEKLFSRPKMSKIYSKSDGYRIMVEYAAKTKSASRGVTPIANFISRVMESGVPEAIIVSDVPLSSTAKTELNSLSKPIIQVFIEKELQQNPTKNIFTPPHSKVPEKNRAKILGRTKLEDLPVLCINDPVVRYYGWVPGDLIRIDRENLSSDRVMVRKSMAYRYVTDKEIAQPKAIPKKDKELTPAQSLGLE